MIHIQTWYTFFVYKKAAYKKPSTSAYKNQKFFEIAKAFAYLE